MQVQESLEDYLMQQMVQLCPPGEASTGRPANDLGLFDVATPFERVLHALGPGKVSLSREIADAPESLRISVEHRYSLARWPLFDFVILESNEGIAWGHTFARRVGIPIPTIRHVTDLARWSHVESEVSAALGIPTTHETWPPWASAVYRFDHMAFDLCYVFGLLQSIARNTDES